MKGPKANYVGVKVADQTDQDIEDEEMNNSLGDVPTDVEDNVDPLQSLVKFKEELKDVQYDFNTNLKDKDLVPQEFLKEAQEREIKIGRIKVDDINVAEQQVQQKEKESKEKRYKEELQNIQQQTRNTSSQLRASRYEHLTKHYLEEAEAETRFLDKKRLIKDAFRTARKNVKSQIDNQKNTIQSQYGPLAYKKKKSQHHLFDRDENQKKLRKMLDWSGAPLPVEINITLARCLKDKIQSGNYVILVSLLDRVGGNKLTYEIPDYKANYESIRSKILAYQKKKSKFVQAQKRLDKRDKGGGGANNINISTNEDQSEQSEVESDEDSEDETDESTSSRSSQGEKDHIDLDFQQSYTKYKEFHAMFNDENLIFNENVYTLLPTDIRPSNVLLFELILLSSQDSSNDYVMGWGVFPVLDIDLQINQGKFKLPLMYGPVDSKIDKFREIEHSIQQNLNKWLCNLYIEIQLIKLEKCQVHHNKLRYYHKEENKFIKELLEEQKRQQAEEDEQLRFGATTQSGWFKQGQAVPRLTINAANKDNQFRQTLSKIGRQTLTEKMDNMHQDSFEIVIDNKKSRAEIGFDEYMFSVSHQLNHTTRHLWNKKMQFIRDELLSDLNFKSQLTKQMKNMRFQITLFIIFMALWVRMYIHYIGQYFYLQMAAVPVEIFSPTWYTVKVSYAQWLMGQDLMAILSGNLLNTLIFLFFVLVVYLAQKIFGTFPKMFCKIICWYGVASILNFYLIAIVDIATLNFEKGDIFKLYWYYYGRDGTGVAGVLLTLLVAFGITVVNVTIQYYYMIFIHANRRVLDVYERLTGNIKAFFLPHDNEVSLAYMRWVLAKAVKFNHRITTYKTTLVDENGEKQTIQYVNAFKFDKHGSLKKIRIFVKDYDGSIKEISHNNLTISQEDIEKITNATNLIGYEPVVQARSAFESDSEESKNSEALQDGHEQPGAFYGELNEQKSATFNSNLDLREPSSDGSRKNMSRTFNSMDEHKTIGKHSSTEDIIQNYKDQTRLKETMTTATDIKSTMCTNKLQSHSLSSYLVLKQVLIADVSQFDLCQADNFGQLKIQSQEKFNELISQIRGEYEIAQIDLYMAKSNGYPKLSYSGKWITNQ